MSPGSFEDISYKMRTFAQYLYRLPLPEAARAYEGFAGELENGVTQGRLKEICQDVMASLRAGPMTISDRYMTMADGTPDDAATEIYYALMDDLRRFARSNFRKRRVARFLARFR